MGELLLSAALVVVVGLLVIRVTRSFVQWPVVLLVLAVVLVLAFVGGEL